eukprot:564603-Pleurochrysis_carterae.AAC.1
MPVGSIRTGSVKLNFGQHCVLKIDKNDTYILRRVCTVRTARCPVASEHSNETGMKSCKIWPHTQSNKDSGVLSQICG